MKVSAGITGRSNSSVLIVMHFQLVSENVTGTNATNEACAADVSRLQLSPPDVKGSSGKLCLLWSSRSRSVSRLPCNPNFRFTS
jgi:hypothetical protein